MSTSHPSVRSASAAGNTAAYRSSSARAGVGSHSAGPVIAGLVAVLLAVVTGCGGGGVDGRLAVSGSVTMNGAPLNDATIEFVPTQPGVSSFGGASIFDGEYRIAARRGLMPGQYKVMISMAGSAPEPKAEAIPGDSSLVPVAPELIPAKYNSESLLTAEVTPSGENRFDFELTR